MELPSQYNHDLFVSFCAADRAWVEGYLFDALDNARVNYISEATFAPGVPRLLEFERAVRESKRTLLVLTPSFLGEHTSQFTDLLVQSFGLETATWPVIPLLLQQTPLPPHLAMLEALDATAPAQWDRAITRLCAELERPQPALSTRPPCPYPGMVPFAEADSDRFFGREREVQALVEQLRLYPFVAVIGASGSGKSSLVFAGLVPALRSSTLFGPETGLPGGAWQVCALRPGESPWESLTTALKGDPAAPQETAAALLQASPGARRLLVIVDQFEETWTVARADQDPQIAGRFQQALLDLARVPGCYVVLTVRADFYPELMASPLWCEIQAHRCEILAMDRDGLQQAIVQPAQNLGVSIEPALVERLIADAADEPGILPLIQETLVLLWERLERRYLSLDAYEALVPPETAADGAGQNGLQVAMARRADAALAELSPEGQNTARRILLRLVHFGQGRADTRRQQPIDRLHILQEDEHLFAETLDHLVRGRLLTVSGGVGAAERRVDISHEALIAGWPVLRLWIAQRREAEQTRRRLESKAAEWVRLQGQGGILEEVELHEAEQWLSSPDAVELGCDQTLTDLVQASRAAIEADRQEHERARQRELDAAHRLAQEAAAREQTERLAARRLRRWTWMLAAIGTFALLMAVAGFYLYRVADRTGKIAQSNTLAAQALRYTNTDARTSLQLALAAVDIADTTQAQNALREALLKFHQHQTLSGHTAAVRTLARSPDGVRFASAGQDNTIRIWHLPVSDKQDDTGSLITMLSGHTRTVRGLAWSPDGKRLASASVDSTLRIWNVATVTSPEIRNSIILTGHVKSVYSVAWSPDGKYLASTSEDNTLRLWDADTGANLLALDEQAGEVNNVDWSPDGARLAYVADDGLVRVWPTQALLALSQAQAGQTIVVTDAISTIDGVLAMAGHRDYALDVAWSPDGMYLASASADGTVRLWNAQTGAAIDSLVGHRSGWVYSVDWSPDGTRLASGSDDTTVRIWDVRSGEMLETLAGHGDWVFNALWRADGKAIVSVSRDKTVRVWDLDQLSVTVLAAAHQGEIREIDWSPDGKWLISGGDDRAVRSWYAGTNYEMTPLYQHSERIVSLRWQPCPAPCTRSNSQIAALGALGTVSLWQSGQTITYLAHIGRADQLAWSPDGQYLATVSGTDGLRLWDAAALKPGPSGGAQPAAQLGAVIQNGLMSVTWRPDGKQIATGSLEGTIYLWDSTTLTLQTTLSGHVGYVWALAWDPQGTQLASASQDHTVRVWDTTRPDEKPILLSEHEQPVSDVAWSPDGTLLASSSDDATVRLWQIPGRQREPEQIQSLAVLTGPARGVWSVAWTLDGRQVAAASMDGSIWVFYVHFEDILNTALEQGIPALQVEQRNFWLGIE